MWIKKIFKKTFIALLFTIKSKVKYGGSNELVIISKEAKYYNRKSDFCGNRMNKSQFSK